MMQYIFPLILLLISFSAFALEQPKGSSFDSRIQTISYNEQNVVKINAYSGIATQVIFSEEEEILDIASGFSEGWQFSNRRNQLYLKPKSIERKNKEVLDPTPGLWNTNVIVTTNLRVYAFQLELAAESGDFKLGQDQKVAFRITFKYPKEEAKKKQLLESNLITQKRLDQSISMPLNWNYVMKLGKKSQGIAPSQAYDDGRFTYLKFPTNQDFPTIFLVSSNRSESLVNSHIDPSRPDVLVVHQVAPRMMLRLGHQVIGIYNQAYHANRPVSHNGTTVKGVKRSLLAPKEILQ